ncbi:MAG: PAS domain S-box protein, partial [Ferruginibacter sp.]
MEISNKTPGDFLSENTKTDELRMRLARQHAKQQLKNIFLKVPVAISILRGPDYIIEVVNEKMLEFWGNRAEAVLNKPLFEALPDLKNGLEEHLAALYTNGKRFAGVEVPLNILRNEALERVFVTFVYEPLYKEDGSIYALIAVAHETTEQVIARQTTEESRHLYHNMIYSSPSLIAVLKGEDMILTIANDAILKQLGKGKDIVGKPYFKSVPEMEEQLGDILKNVYKTGEPFFSNELPVHLVRNDKKVLSYYDFVYQPQRNKNGDIEGVAIIANEVTAQAQFNIKIKESEAGFRLMADLMPEKVINADEEGNVIYYNENWVEYTGFSIEELKTIGWVKLIHPDDLEGTGKKWQQSIESGNDFETETRLLHKNGEYRWHLSRAKAVKSAEGKIKFWIGVNTDIQHQKKQREELEKAVAGRTYELLQANEELQQKNQEVAISKYNKRFLSEFSEKFSAYQLHNEFFNSLVQFIADTTRLDYVFVGKLEQNDKGEQFIKTISITAFGKLTGNIKYPLPGGPCEQVIQKIHYSFPKNCRQLFEKNTTIQQFNAEGYLGYPLNDDKGNAVGLIAVMHGREIEDTDTVSSVLKIIARRAEIEMEIIKNEEELVFQSREKEKRAAELLIANNELAFQNREKENRADELLIANNELAFQNAEKENRADELIIANKELAFQNAEKENRAAELLIANNELAFQNKEKENRAAELLIANNELAFQNAEKENRAAELLIANNELAFQN